MTRGRKAIPTHLKVLAGNPGKRPLPPNEPKGKPGLPNAPKHLTVNERKAWVRLAKDLNAAGIPTNLDGMAFELLVKSYAAYLDACVKVTQYGPIFMEKGDSAIPKFQYSPYWTMANREWDKVKTMLTEFGLTPSSRTKIQATTPQTEGDPLLEMLKKRQSSN